MLSSRRVLGPLLAAGFCLGIWQLIATYHHDVLEYMWSVFGLKPPVPSWSYLASPGRVYSASISEIASGAVFQASFETAYHTMIALAIACFVGVLAAEWLGRDRFVPTSFRPIFRLLNGVPPVTLLPVALVAFGLGSNSVIAIAFYGAVLSILFISMRGFELTPKDLGTSLNQMGYSRAGMWLWKLSTASSQLGTAAREGARWALILAVVGEMHGAAAGGLGAYIDSARLNQDYGVVYVGIISCGLLSALIQLFLDGFSKLLHWLLVQSLLGRLWQKLVTPIA